jgi:diguanylate cyclase (GGDEF)-like protein/PAS domain S-box-containing protein
MDVLVRVERIPGTKRIVFSGMDITELKRTEEALKESESRFRGAFEASGIGMVLVAFDGRWLKVNQSFCDMIGYSENELLAKTFQDITHPDDLKNDLEYVRRLIDDQIPYYRLEKRYYHRDGYIVWGALSVSLVRDARGCPLYFVGQIEDITEKKLFEAKLRTTLITDELTGLYNRRGFFELASEQLRLASRRLVLFFADLDHMKWINDTLGHREGDAALATVARLLKDTFRESDIIGRIGGDEFTILASAATEGEQAVLLTSLQKNIERFNVDHTPGFPISLSIGSACHEPEDPRQLEALLAEADESMYEKKRRGQVARDGGSVSPTRTSVPAR